MSSSEHSDSEFTFDVVEVSDGGKSADSSPSRPTPGSSSSSGKKKYKQVYLKSWEDSYKWITSSSKGKTHFFCRLCAQDYAGGFSEAGKHQRTAKHVKNERVIVSQPSIQCFSGDKKGPLSTSLSEGVKSGSIRIASFIAEHNVPFSVADHLPQLIQSVCPDSDIAKKLKCARTKTSEVIKNVLGRSQEQSLIAQLRTQRFSLLIDESTDVGTSKHLALVVRLKDHEGLTRDAFATLIAIGTKASADVIYNLIMEWISANQIPIANMIGFASDGANVMMGANNSVMTKLKAKMPWLYVFKCICHSFALCASHACEKLPSSVEHTLREVYKYFKYSCQRTAALEEFQYFYETKPHKILHPAATRWLSLHACVKRLLEQWVPLKMYFNLQALEHPDDEPASNINTKMSNPLTKAYLLFLDHILPYIVDLNKEMQTESSKLYVLYSKIESTVKSIMQFFFKKEYYDKYVKSGQYSLPSIRFCDPLFIEDPKKVYYGGGVKAFIITNRENDELKNSLPTFYSNCIFFYQELLRQIFSRFSFGEENNAVKYMHLMSPKCILECYSSSVISLVLCFPNLFQETQYNEIDKEYRLLQNTSFSWINKETDWDFDSFWNHVRRESKGYNQPAFPLLIILADFISILPHSTAAVERIFSVINLNKTKIRNKLKRKTLSGILHAKRFFKKDRKNKNDNKMCHNFEIKKELLSLLTSDNLYGELKQK